MNRSLVGVRYLMKFRENSEKLNLNLLQMLLQIRVIMLRNLEKALRLRMRI
jgi:hypothetical protein